MVTTYKISKHVKNNTFVVEYWDDIPVTEYKVLAPYYGGDIQTFIHNNPVIRRPIFEGLQEFHIRFNI